MSDEANENNGGWDQGPCTLLTCPFCGKPPAGVMPVEDPPIRLYAVWCGCLTRGPHGGSPTEAEEAWNLRANTQAEGRS